MKTATKPETYIEKLTSILARRGYSERTIESYKYWIDRTESHFGDRNIDSLTAKEIGTFFDFIQRRYSNLQTLRSAKSALRFFYTEVLVNPEITEQLPKIGRSKPDPFIPTQEHVLATIQHLSDDLHRIFFSCIYGMGLELIDARSIKAKDVNLGNQTVFIAAKRTHRPRQAPIPEAVAAEVAKIVSEKRPSDFLFSEPSGKQIHEQKLQRAWARARDACGAPKGLTARALRHAYVNHLQLLGIQIGDIIHHLGYNKSSSFEYYSRASQSKPTIFSPLDRKVPFTATDTSNSMRYVSAARIRDIENIQSSSFDYRKLIQLLNELNSAYQNECVFSICFLLRAILDHIPPAFGQQNFSGVASNYGGTRSFKKAMEHLQGSLRNIADGHIHTQLRSSEDIPTILQMNFSNQLDLLLGEIIRISNSN